MKEQVNVKNDAGAQSLLTAGLERKHFDAWATDGRRLGEMEMLFAWEAWKAATKEAALFEREACAQVAEGGRFLHDDAPDARFGKECAAAIRRRSNVE